jgi:hypothetical protein
MRSSKPGGHISGAEIQGISRHGIWLFAAGEEYLLDYRRFPWFREARVRDVLNVQLLHGMHLRWPDLDVDLHLDSLRTPERFPLVSRVQRQKRASGKK